MKKQAELFLTALMFFTRIPVRWSMGHNTSRLLQSAAYFPWIGWIAGAVAALTFYSCSLMLTPVLSVFMSFIATIMLTGAFHEDGFADVCDGFGGGWTKEKILAIMKDSRLGTFGVIGLMSILLFKFIVLLEIVSSFGWTLGCAAMIIGHVLSRFSALTMLCQYTYVNADGGKSGLPFESRLDRKGWLIAGFAPAILICIFPLQMLIVFPAVLLVRIFAGRYFHKWIGGYTGDCLGAIQQMSEAMIYFSILLLCRFT
jgi:adenosylcobinamide-GDP ribazoletransferase